jgi:hypothetical protein
MNKPPVVALPGEFSDSDVVLSPSGRMAAAMGDGKLALVDLRTRAVSLQTINGNIPLLEGVTDDGYVAISGSPWQEIYDFDGAEAIHTEIALDIDRESEPLLARSPNGRYVALAEAGILTVIDLISAQSVLRQQYKSIDQLLWRDGDTLTLMTTKRVALEVPVKVGATQSVIGAIPRNPSVATIDRTGSIAAYLDPRDQTRVHIWDFHSRAERPSVDPGLGPLSDVLLSADGKAVLAAGEGGVVLISKIDRAESGRTEVLPWNDAQASLLGVSISSDGRRVMARHGDDVVLYTTGGQMVTVGRLVEPLAMSASGDRVALSENASSISVRDIDGPWLQVSDAELERGAYTGTIHDAVLSDDGWNLVAVKHGVLHVLNLDPEAWIRSLCSRGQVEVSNSDYIEAGGLGQPARICT